MGMTVITYGGGEILYSVFNAIAMLLNSDKGILNPLMIIAISCGALWAAGSAFFSSQADSLILKYFLPLITITSVLMLPSSSIKIEDIVTHHSYNVDHVPFFLARTAELISSIGYTITGAIESVMHVPNDTSYNATGMIFGSESTLDMSKYRLTNAVLEQNLKRFSKQCVFYDIALNRYTLNDLKKTSDLWGFLAERSSKVRMIPYTDPTDKTKKTRFLNCLEAVKEMTPIFEKEKKYYATQDIIKDLPLTFQALTGLRKEKEELISQQLMMNMISGEFQGERLAKNRAYTQQKSTYVILGSLASSSLITMRAVLEALIYASIILVIPLSVLPGGLSFVTNWLWMLIWLQMWAPFYAILNYIMQTAARAKVAAIFIGLSDPEQGLNFFTSAGLLDIHDNIFALSGYLSASIPFISYAIVKGGVSSFIHLAGSMMTPAHAAATSAAGEQTSGNYSFANTSFGGSSYGNESAFQKNNAPSLSHGYTTEHTGDTSITQTAEGKQIIKQHLSDFGTNINIDETISNGLQNSRQHAEMVTISEQKSFAESASSHGRKMADFSSHLAQSNNHAVGLSERDGVNIQESARQFESTAHDMAEHHGITDKQSQAILMGTSNIASLAEALPVVGRIVANVIPNLTFGRDASIDAIASEAIRIAGGVEFQANTQKILDYAKSDTFTSLDDNGIRYVEGITHSLDKVESSQMSYQAAKTYSDQLSKTESWMEQNSLSIKQTLNQDFVNWTSEKLGIPEARRILTEGSKAEKEALVIEFSDDYRNELFQNFSNRESENFDEVFKSAHIPTISEREKIDHELTSSGLNEERNRLNSKISSASDFVGQMKKETSEGISGLSSKMSQHLNAKSNQGALERLWEGPAGNINMSEKYSENSLPLGVNK